jgi:hypothetical protein
MKRIHKVLFMLLFIAVSVTGCVEESIKPTTEVGGGCASGIDPKG